MRIAQEHITLDSPVIYGSGTAPLIALFCAFTILLAIPTYHVIRTLKLKPFKKHRLKFTFLLMMSLYLFTRSLLLVVPFAWEKFSFYFISDQLPKYFLFVAWALIAIWIGNSILAPYGSNRKCNFMVIMFLFALLITFVAAVILCIVRSVIVTEHEDHTHNALLGIPNAVAFFSVTVSMVLIGSRLCQIMHRVMIRNDFKVRVNVLIVFVFMMAAIFLVRLIHVILNIFKKNPLANWAGKLGTEAVKTGNYIRFNWYIFCFYMLMEVFPSFLLIITYHLLSFHSRKTKKEKKHTKKLKEPQTIYKSESSNLLWKEHKDGTIRVAIDNPIYGFSSSEEFVGQSGTGMKGKGGRDAKEEGEPVETSRSPLENKLPINESNDDETK
ncbi:hypothetical protein BLNAU_8433 [Blattamonas nauphoetae]|uniref:Transmembrane protein n=1 Tax=Blattamonas nauphoetae TaxID=2049346 RepID=A0ABQ9XYQ1_9EUKA|nr:hypothetical protein BLNAU_8433 [Blattamonas nauphoetae]